MAQKRSAQQELAYQLSVLQEQLARLNLKHDRYKEAASVSEKAGAEIEAVLAKMQRRTKVKYSFFLAVTGWFPDTRAKEKSPGLG